MIRRNNRIPKDDANTELKTDQVNHNKKQEENKRSISMSQSFSNFVLQSYDELPEWYQDNEFIKNYYRPVSNSFKISLKSIFKLHNESFNIWSHAIPLVPVAAVLIYKFVSAVATLFTLDFINSTYFKRQLLMIFFYSSPAVMFFFSATLHTFMNHSHKISKRLSCFDYTGIIAMINGGIVTYCYYVFYDYPTSQLIYMLSNIVISVVSLFFVNNDNFYTSAYRPIRGILFVSLGMAATIPAIHLVIQHGLYHCFKEFYLLQIILMAVAYIFGALMFVIRFPEKQFPGKCDLIGSSHNILHLFVVVATGILIYAVESLKYKRESIEDNVLWYASYNSTVLQ